MAFALSNMVHAQQRIYANVEQHSSKVAVLVTLSEVQNPDRAVDADHSNYSTLYTLGIGQIAYQNLQFTVTGKKPILTTPIFLKINSGNGSLLSLLSNFSIQATNNANNNSVGTSYTNNQLLGLLGLFGTDSLFRLPAQNATYDGIRLTVNATISLAFNTNYYYAFFITAPTAGDVSICSGTTATIAITDPQSNFTYALYDNGILVDSSVTGTLTTPVLTTTKTYQLKAWDHGIYDSGLTPVTVTVNPKPVGTLSAVTSVLCQGQPTQLQFNATAGTAPYTLIINSTTYNNIQSGTPFNTSPNATATTTYSLTKITDHNNCTNP